MLSFLYYDYGYYPYYYGYSGYSLHYPWYGDYGSVARRRIVVERETTPPEPTTQPATVAQKPVVSPQGLAYRQQAESAFRDGRFNEAIRLANHALIETPKDGRLLLFVSHALFAVGEYQSTAGAIHQATTLLEKDDWGYIIKNYRNDYRGNAYVEAMKKLNEYIKKDPDAAHARFLSGYHFGFIGHEEYARKQLTKAIELESRDRLAVELLKRFGGKPPEGVPDVTTEESTAGILPSESTRR